MKHSNDSRTLHILLATRRETRFSILMWFHVEILQCFISSRYGLLVYNAIASVIYFSYCKFIIII